MMTAETLSEINQKRRLTVRWPFALLGWFVLFLIVARYSPGIAAVMLLASPAVAIVVRRQDIKRRICSLAYPEEMIHAPGYQQICAEFGKIAASQKVYMERSSTTVARPDKRHNAGADRLVSRSAIKMKMVPPKYLQTNVVPPSIGGKPAIYLFPDTVVIEVNPRRLVAVPYSELGLSAGLTSFTEGAFLYPRDAVVLGKTWQHVNNNGTRDKRKKDNKELIKLQYETLEVTVPKLAHKSLMISAPDSAKGFARAVRDYHPSAAPTLADHAAADNQRISPSTERAAL